MKRSQTLCSLTLLCLLGACGGDGNPGPVDSARPTDGPAATDGGALQWYQTCGDPVCRGYTGPFAGVPLCTTEKAGAACGAASSRCDPKDGCNAQLLCTDKDPKQQVGGCPISRARYKTDLRYLDDVQRRALHQQLQALRLLTYRYRDNPGATHLGFLIDDLPAKSPAADAERDLVDLYGYTSMAVAALQVQAQELQALRAEVATLKRSLRRGK